MVQPPTLPSILYIKSLLKIGAKAKKECMLAFWRKVDGLSGHLHESAASTWQASRNNGPSRIVHARQRQRHERIAFNKVRGKILNAASKRSWWCNVKLLTKRTERPFSLIVAGIMKGQFLYLAATAAASALPSAVVRFQALAGRQNGPTDPGVSKDCTFFETATSGAADCARFESTWVVSHQDLVKWVSRGAPCLLLTKPG